MYFLSQKPIEELNLSGNDFNTSSLNTSSFEILGDMLTYLKKLKLLDIMDCNFDFLNESNSNSNSNKFFVSLKCKNFLNTVNIVFFFN